MLPCIVCTADVLWSMFHYETSFVLEASGVIAHLLLCCSGEDSRKPEYYHIAFITACGFYRSMFRSIETVLSGLNR
jgi:hypothetical protein